MRTLLYGRTLTIAKAWLWFFFGMLMIPVFYKVGHFSPAKSLIIGALIGAKFAFYSVYYTLNSLTQETARTFLFYGFGNAVFIFCNTLILVGTTGYILQNPWFIGAGLAIAILICGVCVAYTVREQKENENKLQGRRFL